MTTPTLTVEIAFDDDPLTVSPTWTDVTAYVRDNPGVRISRGRPTELDTFTAGQCSFSLDNRDGEFSPLNSGSTYNGKLLPGKQVRVTATYSSTDYRLFRGFITGWPQRYAQGKKDAIVPIVAYDALSKLNELVMPDFMYDYMSREIGTLVGVFRLTNGRDLIDAVTGDIMRLRFGDLAEAADLAPGLSGSVALDLNADTYWEAGSGVADATSTTNSYSFWIQTTAVGPSSTDFMTIVGHPTYYAVDPRHIIGVDSSGLLRYEGDGLSFGTVGSTARSSIAVNDGQVHHIAIVQDGTTSITIYIDGEDRTSATGRSADASGAGFTHLGGMPTTTVPAPNTNFDGVLQDIAVFSSALSAAEVNMIYKLGRGYYTESTADRLARTLSAVGWPTGLRDISTSTTGECFGFWSEGATALSTVQLIAATEQGRLFVAGDGDVTFKSRYSHQLDTTGNTSQHTFSDDGADSDYVDVGFDYDDREVHNDITVTGSFGAQGAATDATSIAGLGWQTLSITTLLASADLAQDMADGLLAWRKDPQVRSLPLTSVPQTDPAQWPSVLALDLGQRVTFEITPPGVGSQVATQLILEQMDWDITNALWELTVQASPVPPSVAIYDVDSYDDGCVYGF
jgi:hypothetical protein